jgi:hypothetical protein
MGDARVHTKSAEYLNNNEKLAKLQKLTPLAKSQKSQTEYPTHQLNALSPATKTATKSPRAKLVFSSARRV